MSRIVLTLVGGLGNQLHSLAAGYYFAKKLNKKLIILMPAKLNIEEKSDRHHNLLAFNLKEIRGIEIQIVDGSQGYIYRIIRSVLRLSSRFTKIRPTNLHVNKDVNPRDFENLKKTKRSPVFMEDHYENSYLPLAAKGIGFPAELNLASPSQDYLQLAARLLEENRHPIVGVHIRLGDFKTWNHGSNLLPSAYYRECLKEINIGEKESHIWLFSDEPDEALNMLGNKSNISVISKEYHLSNAEEMKLLSKVDFLIASNSTFSWWSSFWKYDQKSVWFPESANALVDWKKVKVDQLSNM
jgi:hypothetical protein